MILLGLNNQLILSQFTFYLVVDANLIYRKVLLSEITQIHAQAKKDITWQLTCFLGRPFKKGYIIWAH